MSAPSPISALDRSLVAFRSLVLSVHPEAVYWITHEYLVVESDGRTFSGTPTDPKFSPPLPTHVPYSPALAGASCVVPPGTLAYVAFANADASKPFLVRFGPGSLVTPGLPTGVTVDAASAVVNGATVPGVITVGASADAVNAATAHGYALRDGDVVTFNGFTGPVAFSIAGTPGGPTPAVGQSKVKL